MKNKVEIIRQHPIHSIRNSTIVSLDQMSQSLTKKESLTSKEGIALTLASQLSADFRQKLREGKAKVGRLSQSLSTKEIFVLLLIEDTNRKLFHTLQSHIKHEGIVLNSTRTCRTMSPFQCQLKKMKNVLQFSTITLSCDWSMKTMIFKKEITSSVHN